MKKKRLLSILLLLVITFSCFSCKPIPNLLGTVINPTNNENEQQSYIEDLKLVGSYWNKFASNGASRLNNIYANSVNGYSYRKTQDFNLNRDCGTTKDCIYLYESRTYDKSKAITNIISVCSDSETNNYLAWDHLGIEYEIVGGIRVNGYDSSTTKHPIFDLNMGAGGKYIYLYVTRDTSFYNPITEIEILNYFKSLDDKDGWYHVCDKDNIYKAQDFNEGAGGADIYINFSTKVTGWEIFTLHLEDYAVDGTVVTKDVKLELKDKVMTEEILQPLVNKDSLCHFAGYSYNGGEMVQVGDPILYDNLRIKAEWYYDVTLDYSLFGLDDVVYNSVQKVPSLPKIDITGYHMLGWHFEGENILTVNTWLNHGGTLVPVMERAHVKDFDEFVTGLEMMNGWEQDYQRASIYELVVIRGDRKFIKLGFDTSLYLIGKEYKNYDIVNITGGKSLIQTTIDYSELTDEEKQCIEYHKAFLLLCDNDAIQDTIDYYSNEGKVDSILDEVIIDLCNNELARR